MPLLILDVLFIEYQKRPLLSSDGRPFIMSKKTTWPVVPVDAVSSLYDKCSIWALGCGSVWPGWLIQRGQPFPEGVERRLRAAGQM